MIKISEVIVVEGKYDKIKLDNIFDAMIITTDGFRLFKNKEKIQFLKRLAKEKGMIVLTDSDASGFKIRNYIMQCFGDIPVKHAYIPEIYGKERRKAKPGAEGLLGVEGVPDDILRKIITEQSAGDDFINGDKVTKYDFYCLGLTGTKDSAAKRSALARKLGIPAKISANNLIEAINKLYTKEFLYSVIESEAGEQCPQIFSG